MNVFDLFAKLSLDTTAYDKGLAAAKTAGMSLGSGLASAASIGLTAVTAAASAVTAFGAASVKTGADFDKSMSQVAATMGTTVDQIDNLREFAQEMGRTTAFSATQAADALNYMALAGYDAETSMGMLPNVLNLAAAGDMDLARASDMVTDAATAMGMSLEDGSVDVERVTQMVDEMAKAASTGNTSVEQLGDAFLVVGGLAQELNGGLVTLEDGTTATVDGVQELEIALTAMANAGIKGSEAGTHMRNMLLKLASPTSEGTKALEDMGITVFDTEGNMRSLADVFGDLSNELDNMTQEQKIQTISDLFNTRDIASAEALLNAVGQDWDNIGEAILNADGAAEQMAQTQLDNLAGDITLFKSALEGTKIAISDELTPSLRDFVHFGTDGLSTLTSAFKEGGLTGAMDAFGTILADGLNMIIGKVPQFMKAGAQLLKALGKGLMDNIDVLLFAVGDIMEMFLNGLLEATNGKENIILEIIDWIAGVFNENYTGLIAVGLQIVTNILNGITENFPAVLATVTELLSNVINMLIENAPQLIDAAIGLLTGLSTALIENAATLLPAVIQLILAIGLALVDNLPLLVDSAIQIITVLVQAIIENTPLFLDAVIQILVAIVGLIADYGGQALSTAVEWLSNLVSSVAQWFGNMLTTAIEWLSQLPTQMAYWAGFAIGSFIKFFMELPSKVMTFLSNTIAKVQDFGSRLRARATEIAQAFFNNIVTKISELPSRLAELGQSMVDAILDLPDKFMEVGSNIVQGIWNGIKAGWDWLVSSVKDLAESLLEGAKDALGIASPSKEFAWVGKMIDEGFALGITSNLDDVKKAMDSMIAETKVPIDIADVNSVYDSNKYAGYGFVQNLTINSPRELNPSETARLTKNANREMMLRLRTT